MEQFASGWKRNYYGKGHVTAYRLNRDGVTPGDQSAVFGANVKMLIYGDAFWPTYTIGDNTGLVATDSMKNFIQRETLNYAGPDLEDYCRFLATKFLGTYPPLNDPGRRNFVLLLTDGLPNCNSSNANSCTTQGRWEQGWLVFHDVNNNARLDSGEVVLARQEALPKGVRLSGNQPVASYVSYTSLGNTETTGGGFQAGTFTLCNQSAGKTDAREIIIASSGRPRTRKLSVEPALPPTTIALSSLCCVRSMASCRSGRR